MNLLMKLIVLLLGITAVSAHGQVGLPITLEMVVVCKSFYQRGIPLECCFLLSNLLDFKNYYNPI